MDTIHMRLINYEVDFCNVIKEKFKKNSKLTDDNGRTSLRAKLEKLQLVASGPKLVIKGSINKFLNGHNLKNIGLLDVQRFIDKIEAFLEISLQNAEVYRLDVGVNVFMENRPKAYFGLLGEYSGLHRFPNSNGLYYLPNATRKNQRKAIHFYDKVAESDGHISDLFLSRNVLRFEVRFFSIELKKVKRKITVKDLLDKKTFLLILDQVIADFNSIQIVGNSIMEDPNNVKDFRKMLNRIAIKSVGIHKLYEKVKELQDRKLINAELAYRFRKILKDFNNSVEIEPKTKLRSIELTSKIHQELNSLKTL